MAADVGVFTRYKNFNTLQEEAQKNSLANALAQAQLQAVQMEPALKQAMFNQESARKDMEWQRDANLKRELFKMRGKGAESLYVDEDGEIIKQPQRKLSATEQKAFDAQQEKINALETSQDAFNQIKEYQGKPMFSGFGAESLAYLNRVPVIGSLINDEKASNTTAYQNLIKTGQYKQLASTFPGAISNSEREALEKLGAVASYTPQEQAKIVRDAETGIAKLLEKSKSRASDIASGAQYQKAINMPAATTTLINNMNAYGKVMTPVDPRVAAAKAAGYTDEEIQQYLNKRR